MTYEHLKVKEFKHWIVYLHENQCYLGRCVLWCKRDVVDFLDMNVDEEREFFEVARQLRRILRELFRPDHFNYNFLGNEVLHLHVHFVPRYKGIREFNNAVFEDKRWGKSPRPYDFELSASIVEKIRTTIRDSF